MLFSCEACGDVSACSTGARCAISFKKKLCIAAENPSLSCPAQGGEDSSHEMANGDARSGSSGQPRAYKDDAMRNQSGEATRDYVWKWWGYR